MRKIFLGLGALLSGALLASGGGDSFPNEPFHANINDKPSLQTGAKLFVNYCAGCHSIQYQRYNRTFRDLGIDPEIGAKNLIFTGAKEVEQMHIALQPAAGLQQQRFPRRLHAEPAVEAAGYPGPHLLRGGALQRRGRQ